LPRERLYYDIFVIVRIKSLLYQKKVFDNDLNAKEIEEIIKFRKSLLSGKQIW
jgi:hypothetical protein